MSDAGSHLSSDADDDVSDSDADANEQQRDETARGGHEQPGCWLLTQPLHSHGANCDLAHMAQNWHLLS